MSAAPAGGAVEVSAARPEEYAALGELTLDAYVETAPPVRGDYRAALADVAGRAARPHHVVLAARAPGRLLGCCTVVLRRDPSQPPLPEGVAELRMLAVDPNAQGRGAGRALVRAAIALARERGMTVMRLDTQAHMEAARHIYESAGFGRAPGSDRDVPGTDVHLLAYELDL